MEGDYIMKKEWINPTVEMLDLKETAFGPLNPSIPDSDKTAVIVDGELVGWRQDFGEGKASE